MERSPDYAYWKSETKIGPLTIRGQSRGSNKTGFYIPELRLFLDAGIQSPYEPEVILITHSHTDHSFMLPMLLTGISTTPTIYVPEEQLLLFKDFLDATHRLSQSDPTLRNLYPVVGVGDHLRIPLKNSYYAISYVLDHVIPARGYGICATRSKLLGKFLDVPREVLIQAKNNGEIITHEVEEKLVVYLTDTSVLVYDRYPELFEYKNLIVECTFFYEHELELAISAKHTHFLQLKPIIESHPNVRFYIIHLSMRYKESDIFTFRSELAKLSTKNAILL